MAASTPSSPSPRRQPASSDESGAWSCLAMGLLMLLLGGLLVVAVPWLLLFGGLGLLFHESPGEEEGRARAVVEAYYAAVAIHNWPGARIAFEPPPTEVELAALWAEREATRGRVAGFTATAVTIKDGVPNGTVTGTLRYADGTTTTVSVPIRRKGGPGSGRGHWLLAWTP